MITLPPSEVFGSHRVLPHHEHVFRLATFHKAFLGATRCSETQAVQSQCRQ